MARRVHQLFKSGHAAGRTLGAGCAGVLAKSDELLSETTLARFEGKGDLIFTSPPFPLNRKKRYGIEKGEEYVCWLCAFGPLFKKMLSPKGAGNRSPQG